MIPEFTASFDECAGHKSNLTTSVIFANTPSMRKAMKHVSVHGKSIPVRTIENMVGHQISAMKKRTVDQITTRHDKVALRAQKAKDLGMTRKPKTRLFQSAIILAAVSGTLWYIPTRKALTQLKSEVLRTAWGEGRKLRSTEIVLAILNHPTRIDPLAAIVYRRLSDARRLMKKCQNRFHFALHTYELMKEEERRDVFRKNRGLVAGMRQAAIMMGGKLETDDQGLVIIFNRQRLRRRMEVECKNSHYACHQCTAEHQARRPRRGIRS